LLAIPVAAIRRFSEDGAGRWAAVIAYYGFFSLFPLLLVLVTILGLVLRGDPSALASIQRSALHQFPVIGSDLQQRRLGGHVYAVVLGMTMALWAGLGVAQAAQGAFDTIWDVERASALRRRLRTLALLTTVGPLFAASSALSGLAASGGSGPLQSVLGVVVSLAADGVLFAVAFRLLSPADVGWRDLWPGIAVAAVAWELLQTLGGIYVDHVIRGATGTYGTFALVIGLLTWMHIGAQASIFAAEVNVVVARRLWPRAIFSEQRD
jgi:YihY family inner membrane protein